MPNLQPPEKTCQDGSSPACEKDPAEKDPAEEDPASEERSDSSDDSSRRRSPASRSPAGREEETELLEDSPMLEDSPAAQSSPREPREKKWVLHLSKEEKRKIGRKSEEAGLTMNEYIRRKALGQEVYAGGDGAPDHKSTSSFEDGSRKASKISKGEAGSQTREEKQSGRSEKEKDSDAGRGPDTAAKEVKSVVEKVKSKWPRQ